MKTSHPHTGAQKTLQGTTARKGQKPKKLHAARTPHPHTGGPGRHAPQMLASTIQFSNNNPHRPRNRTHKGHGPGTQEEQTPGTAAPGPNSAPPNGPTHPPTPQPLSSTPQPPARREEKRGRVLAPRHRTGTRPSEPTFHPRAPAAGPTPAQRAFTCPTPRPRHTGRAPGGEGLLRKEVIQPHLPVRLPCYDLVPIASPTFDGSPHKGWATGFGCYRLS